MNKDLRVLMVEDSVADAELIMHQLYVAGYQLVYELVDTAHDTRRALSEKQWDVVLCDYSMPNFDPYKVLDILRETELDIPLIVISGKIGEDNAIKLLRAGCHDCIRKSDLRRLPDVINREINEAIVREENRILNKKLQKYQILANEEKEKRAEELLIANKELVIQNEEKDKRAEELVVANKELAFQNDEKDKRAAELIIANKELAFQTKEKAGRAAELIIADKELVFQTGEKADRAAELIIADKELVFQTGEKADRAAELVIANKELAFQNEEKDKRAAELVIANKELFVANKELFIERRKTEELNNQLEFRVTERTAQLEFANRELEEFSYAVSHDLKAPLRHITGYVSLLVKKYTDLLPEEGRHYFDNISSSAKDMGELIDGLLQLSKTGRIDMNQGLLNMNEILDTLIPLIRDQDQERRIEWNIDPMPLSFGDFDMIKSVWRNLIENAVKFTKNKDLTKITIGAKENKNNIIYYVKDNGVGFDMNYATKLFTLFQRLHSHEDYEGTGIGLATVQKIITKHGGKVWGEGKVGEGATFYFSLTKRKEGI